MMLLDLDDDIIRTIEAVAVSRMRSDCSRTSDANPRMNEKRLFENNESPSRPATLDQQGTACSTRRCPCQHGPTLVPWTCVLMGPSQGSPSTRFAPRHVADADRLQRCLVSTSRSLASELEAARRGTRGAKRARPMAAEHMTSSHSWTPWHGSSVNAGRNLARAESAVVRLTISQKVLPIRRRRRRRINQPGGDPVLVAVKCYVIPRVNCGASL